MDSFLSMNGQGDILEFLFMHDENHSSYDIDKSLYQILLFYPIVKSMKYQPHMILYILHENE